MDNMASLSIWERLTEQAKPRAAYCYKCGDRKVCRVEFYRDLFCIKSQVRSICELCDQAIKRGDEIVSQTVREFEQRKKQRWKKLRNEILNYDKIKT